MAQTFTYSGYVFAHGFDNPLLALYNNSTGKAKIVYATARQLSPTLLLPDKTLFYKITSLIGGDDVSVAKANTSDSNLPTQIQIKTNCLITKSSIVSAKLLMGGTPISPTNTRTSSNRYNSSSIFHRLSSVSDIQAIRIAEGEGFALAIDSSPTNNVTWCLVARIAVGSNYYYLTTSISGGNPSDAAFAIMNNTGSGINIDLIDISIFDIGDVVISTPASNAPYIGYKLVDSIDGGEEVSAISFDTSNSLPSSVKVYRSTLTKPMISFDSGSKRGAPNREIYGYPSSNMIPARSAGLYRQQLKNILNTINVGLAHSPFSEINPSERDIKFSTVSESSPVIINNNEGFSIQAMNMSPYNSYYVELRFLYEPATTPSGGLKSTIFLN